MPAPRIINLDEQARIGSLTTDIIADLAVTGPKLAIGAVSGDSIADGGIGAVKLNVDVFGAGVVPNVTTNAIDVNVDNATLEIVTNLVQVKVGGINQTHISLTGNIDFSNNEALNFRIENVNADPTPGNVGRLIWRTDLNQLKVDDGGAFSIIGSGSGGHIIEDEGSPLTQRATLNFVGSGVTVTDSGSKTIVTIPGGGSVSYARTLKVVINPLDKIISLSFTPVSNSEVVSWNGLELRPGLSNDYTISGSTVTLNGEVNLTIGDELQVVFAH